MIIGVCGNLGVGKTTFSHMLADHINDMLGTDSDYEFTVESFAKPVKDVSHLIAGGKVEKDEIVRGLLISGRELYQTVGDGIRELLGDDVWYNHLINRCEGLDVVVDDVRYRNECDGILERDGIIIRVNRDVSDSNKKYLGHRSERDLDGYTKYDCVVDNSGTLEELDEAARLIAIGIIERINAEKHGLVYISGKIRGLPNYGADAFNAAEKLLTSKGHKAFNPSKNFDSVTFLPRFQYMRHDIKMLTECTGIALIPGWETSEGAIVEIMVAKQLRLEFYDATTGDRISPPELDIAPREECIFNVSDVLNEILNK